MLSTTFNRISRFSCNNLFRRSFMADSSKGPIQIVIEQKLTNHFKPSFLSVVNESYKHGVPKGSESHFKVVVVSENFNGQSLIQRHRSVNTVIKDEVERIHALSIQAKTAEQWASCGQQPHQTPNCLGGSKFEKNRQKT